MYEVHVVMNCFIMVKWLKPPPLIMKLNSDGSCLDGNCRGGGIVRGSDRCIIMAYLLPLGPGTSNTAEASALLYGLKWCINYGFNSIIRETDSLILQNSVTGQWDIPWRISDIVEEIKLLVNTHDIKTRHCYREANRVANKLASLSHNLMDLWIYNTFDSLHG
ncbi:uncharacterized protein LOC142168347 [Nicotiana tabacum]|uniref:Uncharacterized protein LOC142168347 n=1 Tax=Nicotiana tabacum TaxID=4097 RepID=A0AC58SJI6_TOBAC